MNGNRVSTRGLAKKTGGIGKKITGKSKRKFYPNLQTVRVIVNGTVKRMKVSTRALKKGLVTKAPRRRRPEPAAGE